MSDPPQTMATEAPRADGPTSPAPQARASQEQTQAATTKVLAVTRSIGRGSVVGRYVVLEEVGRGAMGIVYSAYDPKLDRKIALKILKDRGRDEQSLREAQALARLNHPNVVQVYDAGEHEGRIFMAMEFVVGQPLDAWRKCSKPSLSAVLRVFQCAAAGLSAAHERGLVHRDFKPDNVMVAQDGRGVVMDFGLAVPRDDDDAPGRPRAGASGTPAYMSPEQFSNRPLDPRSDQFSFFVALYEALASERPFAGESIATLVMAVTSGRIAHANPLRGMPAWLRRTVLRGLSVDPHARHESMQEVAEILEQGMARRERRAVAVVASVALVGVLGAWALGSTTDDPATSRCREHARALTEQWVPQWEPKAQSAFVGGLEIDGEQVWRRVRGNVDAFVQAWATSYDGACSARFSAQPIELAAFERRTRCLDDQREYTTSLLESLQVADDDALREIAAVTAELPRPAACDSERPGRGEFDEATQQLVVDAQRRYARAEGRADAGDRKAARELATETLASLDGVDAPSTRGRLLIRLAKLDYDEGDLVGGQDSMRAALRAMARSGDAAGLADAWLTRVGFVSGRDKDSLRAEHLLEAAEAAVAAVPEDLELASRLDSLRGRMALEGGRFREAREWFAAAIDAAERGGLGRRSMIMHLNGMGAAEAQLGNLAEARTRFMAAGKLATESYGERHTVVVQAYANLGLLCRQEGDRKCERDWVEKALALSDPRSPTTAKQQLHLGQLEYDEGNFDFAEAHARESIATYSQAFGEQHPDLTAPRLLLSNVLRRRGDLDGAYEQAQAIMAIAEAATPPGHPKRAIASSTLGEVLRARGELEPALAAHRTALEIRRAALEPSDPRIAYSLVHTAHCLRQLGRDDEARSMASQAIALLHASPANASWRAEAQFIVARTLGPHDARGRTSAEAALVIYRALGPGFATEAAELRDWLGSSAGPATATPSAATPSPATETRPN